MNNQQIKWASQHDWYRGVMRHNGSLTLYVKDDMTANKELSFTNFTALKIWAGY